MLALQAQLSFAAGFLFYRKGGALPQGSVGLKGTLGGKYPKRDLARFAGFGIFVDWVWPFPAR